ncbi:MAG: hypothetical protein H0U74_10000 [Bradymonadaceae bacterium]|nr:hypothetical protein [Lujinxingiaceae bacterium]
MSFRSKATGESPFSALLNLLILVAVVASSWLMAPQAAAQGGNAEMEALLKQAGTSTRKVQQGPLAPPSVTPVNMDVHWRLWKRVANAGQAGVSELTAFRNDARSLGYHNMPTQAMAIVTLARRAEQQGGEPTMIIQLYRQAQRLAPDLPYPYLAHASYLFRKQTAEVPSMAASYFKGIERGVRWLDTRLAWQLKIIVLALIALLGASFVFLFTQLVRYFGIAAYDATRVLPRGFSSGQTVLLTIVLVVMPGLLLRSPLLSLIILLALVAVFQQLNERIVTAVIFSALALLPFVDHHMGDLVSFPGSRAQALMHAQYFVCDPACTQALADQAGGPQGDALTRFTHALAIYRTGDTARFQALLTMLDGEPAWPVAIRGEVDNLRGAIHVALGKPEDAAPYLVAARTALPTSAAPSFNMMRAYQLAAQEAEANSALQEASARDMAAVGAFIEQDRRDVNNQLMVPPLGLGHFWKHHTDQQREDISMIGPIWNSLAGERLVLDWAPYLGGLGLLIVILCAPLRRMHRTSTPCPKCGLARDPNDAHKMAGHHYCLPCYRTFLAGASLSYEARVHNETVLGRRDRMQAFLRRTLSLIVPGTGHALAGHALLGFGVTFTLIFAALALWQPMGIWRSPFELFTGDWLGQRALAWAALSICACIGLNAAWRDIVPTRIESPRARKSP